MYDPPRQSGIQAGSPCAPPQLQFVLCGNDAESSLKPKRRRTEDPKPTISERGRRARETQAEMLIQARKLMEMNQPLPPDLRKAYDRYERHKKRNREYQRNRRAPGKAKVVESEEKSTGSLVSMLETGSTFVHAFSPSFGNSPDRTPPLNGTTTACAASQPSVHTYSSGSSLSSAGDPLPPSPIHMPSSFDSASVDLQFFNPPSLQAIASHPFDQPQLNSDLPLESSGSQALRVENTVGSTPRSLADKVIDIPGNHTRVLIELYEHTRESNPPDAFKFSPIPPAHRGVHQITFSISNNDIHGVSAETSGNITTNNIGRHSKKRIECVAQDEKEAPSHISAESLDVDAHNFHNTRLSNDKLTDNKSKPEASKDEYRSKQKELEGLADSTGGAPPGAITLPTEGFLRLLRIIIN